MSKFHKKQGGVQRKHFPALSDFLQGYLNEDFMQDHGTTGEAARAFLVDANAAERSDLIRELSTFMQMTSSLSTKLTVELLTKELGGGWAPEDREELDQLLAALTTAR